jgi:DNA polymerase/3'-5' exonuclease PolX
VQEMPAPASVTDLATFPDLNPDHLELLQSQGIHTLEQAKEYLASNKSFRPLKGIGRAGDEQIRSALGL